MMIRSINDVCSFVLEMFVMMEVLVMFGFMFDVLYFIVFYY